MSARLADEVRLDEARVGAQELRGGDALGRGRRVGEERAAHRREGDERGPERRRRPAPARARARGCESEYSDCTAATGCTAAARRSEEGAISEKPTARVLPARTRPGQRLGHLLDRHLRVAAVDVEEIDRLEPEPLRLPSSSAARCAGRIVEAPPPGRRVAPDRRLGGDAEAALPRLPLPGEEAADHALRQAAAVDVRGVDMVDPEVERRGEERVRLLLRGLPVDAGEGHRPDPDRRNLRPAGPQPALLHFTGPRLPGPGAPVALSPRYPRRSPPAQGLSEARRRRLRSAARLETYPSRFS